MTTVKNITTTDRNIKKIGEKTVVLCSLFLVPNAAWKLTPSSDEITKDRLPRYQDLFGTSDDTFVEVWLHNDREDNLLDHYYRPFLDAIKKVGKDVIHGWFPASVFKGHKEGDQIFIDIPKADIVLVAKLQQKGFRYQDFGNFEEALEYVISKAH